MSKYTCLKCGMIYEKPGKCMIYHVDLIEITDPKKPEDSKHHNDWHQCTIIVN